MGGATEENKSVFVECLSLTWRNPFVLYIAFSAAIGSLLFGYDTGVISGAILYIRNDFKSVDRSIVLQETIVTMAVAGAMIGASVGGWISDRFGRRTAILLGDLFFFVGSAIMALAINPDYLIVGRITVGVGVGISSITSPLYVSESSPTKIRGALVSINGVLVTGGNFLSFLVNLAFTKVPGTWRWMLGVAAIPAVLQFGTMLLLPESPRWLYRKNHKEEAVRILRKIHPENEVEAEIEGLMDSVEEEKKQKDSPNTKMTIINMLKTRAIRKGLTIGISLQVFQQFVGINTVMYYSTTIIQLAGYASNEIALKLSLIMTTITTLSTIFGMLIVDRIGRRIILIVSISGVILSLGLLSTVFHYSAAHSPLIDMPGIPGSEDLSPYTCPAYQLKATQNPWDCTQCLAASSVGCGFCASAENKLLPGACLILNSTAGAKCEADHRLWYTRGCPSKYGWLAMLGLGAYVLFFSPGLGSMTWIINSEIYPLRYRGVCIGISGTVNWLANLILSQTFLSITHAIGISATFMIYGCVGVVALIFVLVYVPETKGLHIEEVEKMLEHSSVQWKFWKDTTPLQDKTVEQGLREPLCQKTQARYGESHLQQPEIHNTNGYCAIKDLV